MSKKQKKLLYRIIISFVLFLGVIAAEKVFSPHKYIIIAAFLVPYFVAGYDVLRDCLKNVFRGKLFDETFLMTIATVGAFVIGEYPESVFVMLFYQVGELFQSVAVGKSRRSIKELMELFPDEATLIRDGEEQTVFPEEICEGDVLLVRPGEKIAVDSIITEGDSSLDMKALTGESAPVEVKTGDSVKAGCINLTGVLTLRAQKEYSESTAAKILELVENSTLHKAKTEKFLTRFSKYYTPAVVILAVLVAVIPSLITGDWKEWVYRALIFLVVSCPCALVISVPLSYFSGIGLSSKHGILIKGASYLEALEKAGTFVFDKTGTLTTGQFRVSEIFPEDGFTKKELLDITASAEYYSSHPLARGIISSAGEITPPEDVKESSGFGVEATVQGRKILAGSRRFLSENGVSVPDAKELSTAVFVAADGKFSGVISLQDTEKEGSLKAVSALKNMNIRNIVMLTGDNSSAAEITARSLGIPQYEAGLLPADKVEKVRELCEKREKNRTVVFVGDGINDAPVLALSDVGIAMGGVGSDAAIEAADIVIMDDSIEKCSLAVKIAKMTGKKVRQNVFFALFVKFAVLLLSALGITNMWLGVIADVGVAVAAIINAVTHREIK